MKYFADIIGAIKEPLNLIALICLLLAGITWKFSGSTKNRWMLPGLFVLFFVIVLLVSFQNKANYGNGNSTTQTSFGNNSPNIIGNGSVSVSTTTNNNTSGGQPDKQPEKKLVP